MSTDPNSPDPSPTLVSTTEEPSHESKDAQTPVPDSSVVHKRVGTQRVLVPEKQEQSGSSHAAHVPHVPAGGERTTSSTKEQVRWVERTSDLQREIPRLIELKKQELQARKTFFVTETYDEWQDTFISADNHLLPEQLFLESDLPSTEVLGELHELEQVALPNHDASMISPEHSEIEAFLNKTQTPQRGEEHTLSLVENQDVAEGNRWVPDTPPLHPETEEQHQTQVFPQAGSEDDAGLLDSDDTINTKQEDVEIPDVLDIGEVGVLDEQWNDTVILKGSSS